MYTVIHTRTRTQEAQTIHLGIHLQMVELEFVELEAELRRRQQKINDKTAATAHNQHIHSMPNTHARAAQIHSFSALVATEY